MRRRTEWALAVVVILSVLFLASRMLRPKPRLQHYAYSTERAIAKHPKLELTRKFSVPVLMYHEVDDLSLRESRKRLFRGLTVPPDTFRKQMEYLAEEGFTVVPLKEVESALRDQGVLPSRAVAITFDDGYDGVYKHAFPVLRELRMPATVFVVTSSVGMPKHVTWSQLRLMRKYGIDSASHTVTHPDLTQLPLAQVDRELRNSRYQIEERIGEPVTSLAYPASRYNGDVAARLGRSGYFAGWMDHGGPVRPSTNPRLLTRVRIDGRASLAEFKRLMRPHSSRTAPSPNRR